MFIAVLESFGLFTKISLCISLMVALRCEPPLIARFSLPSAYGLDVEPFPQTFARFNPVAKSLEVFAARKRIEHNGDPVLAWAMGNVVMMVGTNHNIKPNKIKAPNKIDPAVACMMSFGTYLLEHGDVDVAMSEKQKARLEGIRGGI